MRGKRQTNREEGQIMVTLMAEWEIKWSFFSGGDALAPKRTTVLKILKKREKLQSLKGFLVFLL